MVVSIHDFYGDFIIKILWNEEMKEKKKWLTPGFEPATFHLQSEDIDHHTTEGEYYELLKSMLYE